MHSKAERCANCQAVPVGLKGKLNSRNGYAVTSRRRGKMLPDVGMVQMYSKSANLIDRSFAWTGWAPLCMDRPSSVFLQFSARWFAIPFRDTLHHPCICPCFWRKHFYTPINKLVTICENNIMNYPSKWRFCPAKIRAYTKFNLT